MPKVTPLIVGLFQVLVLPSTQELGCLWGTASLAGPCPRSCLPSPTLHPAPSTPTHQRARGTEGRNLTLLRAAVLLCQGTEPILHSPEQQGVQVSILARGHLDDWGTQRGALSSDLSSLPKGKSALL